jgi:hypothetical protein
MRLMIARKILINITELNMVDTFTGSSLLIEISLVADKLNP